MTNLTMSESDLQEAVIDLARHCGWQIHHCRPARTSLGGWTTPIQGNPGFVDLVLAHPTRGVVFVELKSHSGQVTDHQAAWISVLRQAGADVRVWRPEDWHEIETTLTALRETRHDA